MQQVEVFLKTELFSLGDSDAVPPRALILGGRVQEQSAGGLLVEVHTWRRSSGSRIEGGKAMRIFVPMAKIDHVRVIE